MLIWIVFLYFTQLRPDEGGERRSEVFPTTRGVARLEDQPVLFDFPYEDETVFSGGGEESGGDVFTTALPVSNFGGEEERIVLPPEATGAVPRAPVYPTGEREIEETEDLSTPRERFRSGPPTAKDAREALAISFIETFEGLEEINDSEEVRYRRELQSAFARSGAAGIRALSQVPTREEDVQEKEEEEINFGEVADEIHGVVRALRAIRSNQQTHILLATHLEAIADHYTKPRINGRQAEQLINDIQSFIMVYIEAGL